MQEQLKDILQQQLRDVHTPEAISWWPLAIGWWIVMVLLLGIAVGLICLLLKRRRDNRYRVAARNELNNIFQSWQSDHNGSQYLQCANRVLKRTALHLGSSESVAQLSGDEWSEYLHMLAPGVLSTTSRTALSVDLYRATPVVDIMMVHQEISDWIAKHREVNGNRHQRTRAPEASHA